MAAQENHLEVVKFLLENGANQSLPTEVRPADWTPSYGSGRSSSSDLPSCRMGSPPWRWPCSRATRTWWRCLSTTAQRERSACRRCTLPPATTTLGPLLCCCKMTPTPTSSARLVVGSPGPAHFLPACPLLVLSQTCSCDPGSDLGSEQNPDLVFDLGFDLYHDLVSKLDSDLCFGLVSELGPDLFSDLAIDLVHRRASHRCISLPTMRT